MSCACIGYGEPLPQLPINTEGEQKTGGGGKFWRTREGSDREGSKMKEGSDKEGSKMKEGRKE
jgi:hypothetical protein